MHFGRMRTRITIQAPTYATNDYGESVPTYSTLATVWCKWEPQTQKELSKRESAATEDQVKVTMRYLSTVTTKCRVSKDGALYNILSAIDLGDLHGEMELVLVRHK